MQAFGSDRVRRDGEQVTLLSRLDKGWTARVEKTYTSAEFPGTAVLWEEQYFEVVLAESMPQGGVRYLLEPWREHHAMRFTDRYDAQTEAERIEESRLQLQRQKARFSANVLALLTGHLPAIVQNQLGNELGILPVRLTFISVLGELAVIGGLVLLAVSFIMRREPIPLPIIAIAIFFGIENTVRFFINWTQSRPIGSTLGFLFYLIFHLITGRGPSPFAYEKGWAVTITDAPAEVATRDAYATREAFVTLLTPADQARVAERYGYDYRHDSSKVAAMILIVAMVGMVSSYVRGALISLIVAALLATEQILRLITFRRGPAASVLRFLVRPFMRKLL
jgi:hypothetical protein